MKRVTLVSAMILGLFGNVALASDSSQAGDADKGKVKAAVCGACHGADGNSANAEWPKLAGQHATYLEAQLHAYKSAERKNPIMVGQVAALSDQDIKDLAAYFAGQRQTSGLANPELVEKAETIYRGGLAEAKVPACAACHGPQGLGNAAAAYPRVSGQHAAYTIAQLKAYRSGDRAGTDAATMMSQVAAGLSDADIEALASYISGLH
ncbi:MAG: c-type cytochrome [Oceanococcus sp.]